MNNLQEDARAKVNLTLRVLGKRPDGYHEISSLAVFASAGDRLVLEPGKAFSLEVVGPFAAALSGQDNLVEQAVSLFLDKFPRANVGAFTLDKKLPVAAGLGGGSADAAVALKLFARANPGMADPQDLKGIANRLGSDVAVCLESRAALMRGRGEEITILEGLPILPAVLVNPGVKLGADEVYEALDAPPLDSDATASGDELMSPATIESVARHISSVGNELQVPAMKLAPVIGDVLEALAETGVCLAAQMSGSGPTCFAVYPDENAASTAATELAKRHTEWWICETELN